MSDFTPLSAAIGGALIGAATVAYRSLAGRYAGISGIARSVVFGDPDRPIDALFVVGLLAGGALWFWGAHHGLHAAAAAPLWLVGVGGLLVGAGTTLGGGCTSGHGVCGLARFSLPSLVAVVTFVAFGMVTVTLLRALGIA
jgi:uncharacterized membrane protein YedE/YeeE